MRSAVFITAIFATFAYAAEQTTKPNTKVAQLDETCGGFFSVPCAEGLTCQRFSGISEGIGRCVAATKGPDPSIPKVAQFNETCGGFFSIPCAEGLTCRKSPGITEGIGRCVAGDKKPRQKTQIGKLDERCSNWKRCIPGLQCLRQTDGTRVCKK